MLEINLELNEDLYFDIASKIKIQTGIIPLKKEVEKVFDLIKNNINLDDINFSLFDWCGYKKIIINFKG